ncbi:uncharacterized protein LOC106164951 isoform X2 [Lingula anatina]|uniref:Uncharacterized protein LOC106159128 isoform X2 n=2 Tax=Lingula anatina TaxID=7574 RepID=A0A1S3HYY3_LINAN|nr:uncharacterized protein LOC106159128 isoform X2 [Lingula anatina]XP_013398459.1 uncharacterized protein LOC106164951 isoform X2 [Lingula anatina]|eukprot:XP_013390781.1 uncharacterized protein LOC106159128 isoform X2 [Lingula anatina]
MASSSGEIEDIDNKAMLDEKKVVVGRKAEFLPEAGENKAYVLLSYIFPCEGTILSWEYFRRDSVITPYACVWRRVAENGPHCYMLVGYTELPPSDSVDGHQVVPIDPSERIQVKPGDILGIFHSVYNIHGAVATAKKDQGVDEDLHSTILADVYEEDIDIGDVVDFQEKNMTCEKRSFSIRAHVQPS